MKKLLTDWKQCHCHLETSGATPRGPSFVCPGGGSLGPERLSSRPGQRGASQAPRARHLTARGAPGGRLIPLQLGSLHFQGPESNNKPIGAAAPAPLSHAAQHPSGPGSPRRRPPRPDPEPSRGKTRRDQRTPQAHRPARLLAFAATPASLSAVLARTTIVEKPRGHARRGSRGRGAGGRRRDWAAPSPRGHPPPPSSRSLCAK